MSCDLTVFGIVNNALHITNRPVTLLSSPCVGWGQDAKALDFDSNMVFTDLSHLGAMMNMSSVEIPMLGVAPLLRLIRCHEQREILDLRTMSVMTGNQYIAETEVVVVAWRSVDTNSGFVLVDISETFHQEDGARQVVIPDFDYDSHLTMTAQRLLNHVPHASDGSSNHLREAAISIKRMAAGWGLSHERVVVHKVPEKDDQGLLTGGGSLEEIIRRFIEQRLPNLQVVVCAGFIFPTQHAKMMITDRINSHHALGGIPLGSGDRLDPRGVLG